MRNSFEPVSLTPYGSNSHPALAAGNDGTWAFWQCFDQNGDRILGRRFNGRDWEETFAVSDSNGAYRPRATAACSGGAWVTWSECEDGLWNIRAAKVETEAGVSRDIALSESGCDHHSSIASLPDGSAWVAWNRLGRGGRSRIMARHIRRDGLSPEYELTPDSECCYRPVVAVDSRGAVCIAFEKFEGGIYHIYYGEVRDGSVVRIERITPEKGTWSGEVALAPDESGGIWAMWYEIGTERYLSYRLRRFDGNTWGPEHEVASFESWYACHDVVSDGSGGAYAAMREIFMRFDGDDFELYRVYGNGNYIRRPSIVRANDGDFWIAWQRGPRGDHCSGYVDNREGEIFVRRFNAASQLETGKGKPRVDLKPIQTTPHNRIDPSKRETIGEYNVYWGDIHGQIQHSDGLGTCDHFYNYEKQVSHMDFGAITDHSAFPDKLTDSQFEIIRHYTNLFNEPGKFVTLVAYEWSANEWKHRYGHRNVYFPGEDGRCFRICDSDSDTPDKLFERAREYGAIAPPHHVDCNWGGDVVTADTDWSYHDQQAVPVTEICSHHGNCEYFGNPRPHHGQSQGRSVQNALAMGYRLGFIGGSDTHEMMPGADWGIAAVLAKELTREAVFDAIKNRRCYASTGVRAVIDFTINGEIMGSEIRADGERRIEVHVRAPFEIAKITVVKNNEDHLSVEPHGNQGSISAAEPASDSSNYYYVRVTMADGHAAWSSPIWVN